MLSKKILALSPGSSRDTVKIILLNWVSLLCNVTGSACLSFLVRDLSRGAFVPIHLAFAGAGVLLAGAVRFVNTLAGAALSFRAGSRVKRGLREGLYQKLISLGPGYHRSVPTAEAVQLSGEGVDQLEIYFGRYLAQFFYSLLAPATLFIILSFISVKIAVILLIAVPLIPLTIALVQRFAKRLLAKYWAKYTQLGDSFLENLQGLDTLKIYGADEARRREMNSHAENFRKITMRVLLMQLNSITVMDLIAYGGAAAAMILSFGELAAGALDLGEAFFITLIGAEFFLPMRVLGSYFHIAMNGVAAADKIFRIFQLPPRRNPAPHSAPRPPAPEEPAIRLRNLSFSYDGDRRVLENISLDIPRGAFIALVGESGSGKSTIAGILAGQAAPYQGQAVLGGWGNFPRGEIADLETGTLRSALTLVRHNSYLFAGTLRDNLLLGKADASAEEMATVLDRVGLGEFLQQRQGLDTAILEGAANLSGGQKQRLALARALLHDTEIYIFDEVSSNIDMESEALIMEAIKALARRKTVLLITHRLANAAGADKIAVLEGGRLAGFDDHEALLRQGGVYQRMYREQQELESFAEGRGP